MKTTIGMSGGLLYLFLTPQMENDRLWHHDIIYTHIWEMEADWKNIHVPHVLLLQIG